jgi:WhiB family redox-sensing transcriptional regulator
LWFAAEDASVAEAKSLCSTCPERAQCLRGALQRGEPWGVWGGELFHRGEVVTRLPRQTVALRAAQLSARR